MAIIQYLDSVIRVDFISIDYYYHSKMFCDKCASEKRNVEEVRHKIKVSNNSATKLVRNMAETKPTESGSLFTIRCYGEHTELPNRNVKNPLEG